MRINWNPWRQLGTSICVPTTSILMMWATCKRYWHLCTWPGTQKNWKRKLVEAERLWVQMPPHTNKGRQQITKNVCHLQELLALHFCWEQNGCCFASAFQISCKFLLEPTLSANHAGKEILGDASLWVIQLHRQRAKTTTIHSYSISCFPGILPISIPFIFYIKIVLWESISPLRKLTFREVNALL